MAKFPIVGIGSSAGGLEALEKLFGAMPPDAGVAFVVVAHLDPTRESHLTELLSRRTEMPVVEVTGKITVEPDHVYVIAPDQYLRLNGDVLHPSKPSEPRGHRRPVDTFFRSLAENSGARGIGVILSGTGTNGSHGLRFIKAEGGIAITQDPESAGYAGMPQSAIATGMVDLVLPPEKIPGALLDVIRHPYVRQPEAVEQPDVDGQLSALLAVLRAQTRLDFEPYKRQTLLRRTYRRMGLHRIENLADYLKQLQRDPQEVSALARDLTITVSGFLRDPEAWQALDEKVITPLVKERAASTEIRVWVPGCATGEEAYSVAMLIAARADEAGKSFELRIFATDVCEHVLPAARSGLYPASIAGDVGTDRLARFFEVEGDTYQVRRALRDVITFAPQNLLQDPPFSRLDLISCRNLLIYLEPQFQKKVLALFHFALRQGGHLFLGPAESMSGQEGLFQAVSKKWRIYRRLGPTRHDIVDFPLVGPGEAASDPGQLHAQPRPEPHRSVLDPFHRTLLERYAPASVLIDREGRARAFQGPTGDYLQQPGGEPTGNLIALAREGLQMPLRGLVQRALADGQEASIDARVKRGGTFHPVRIAVSPLGRGRDVDGMLLVSFFEGETAAEASVPADGAEDVGDGQLEAELMTAREDLRLMIEQMEASNEELKASNEEIRSINEELQASNEELETSKEELQSLNEEMNTLNNQLQAKVEELEVRTADLNNLLNSTDVATLFLDSDLRIRWFTPAMKSVLDLIPTDVGRSISHFAQEFAGNLVEEAQRVLANLSPSDAEVPGAEDHWYIRRIVPYRTADNRIAGVVVTFTDITERKRGEQALQRLAAIVESSDAAIVSKDLNGIVTTWNQGAERLFGYTAEEIVGKSIEILMPPDRPDEEPSILERIRRGEHIDHYETVRRRKDGSLVEVSLTISPVKDAEGRIIGASKIARDITERRRGEQERELLTRELSHRVKNILAVVQALAMQTDGSGSIETFRNAFVGRLSAMTRAHNLLLAERWRTADLEELVALALQAYRVEHPEVIAIEGGPVALTARQGLALSLILHELGTNAAKYGALSRPKGRVHLSWRLEEGNSGRRVRLRWQERGGPRVEPPAEKGFGIRLVERACTYELDGEVELEYAPGGLRCEVMFPST